MHLCVCSRRKECEAVCVYLEDELLGLSTPSCCWALLGIYTSTNIEKMKCLLQLSPLNQHVRNSNSSFSICTVQSQVVLALGLWRYFDTSETEIDQSKCFHQSWLQPDLQYMEGRGSFWEHLCPCPEATTVMRTIYQKNIHNGKKKHLTFQC